MSRSSIWVTDKNYCGDELTEYGNSWLFSPIAWDVLLDKYLNDEIQTPYGYKKNLITGGSELFRSLNVKVNNCNDLFDRIVWELSNQQIFFVKDKRIVAEGIRKFLKTNTKHDKDNEGISPLELEHIKNRWLEIAADIENLSDDYECFIFKNTSCDDGVENWFEKYNEETEEYEPCSLKNMDRVVAEFVHIEGKTMEFTTNLDFFKEDEDQ